EAGEFTLAAADEQGRIVVGGGDNVFKAGDVTGIARFISDVDRVMDMLTDGVPPDTVAIIDDSGGTLTAPILEEVDRVQVEYSVPAKISYAAEEVEGQGHARVWKLT